jgi:hypothetical protein
MKELSDLTTPNEIAPRRMLEKDVQKQCVNWARARGYWVRKFSSLSQRSVPDYLFAKQMDETPLKFAVEFKRPGGKPTEAQMHELCVMIVAGWEVFDCDDFEKFKAKVWALEQDALEI